MESDCKKKPVESSGSRVARNAYMTNVAIIRRNDSTIIDTLTHKILGTFQKLCGVGVFAVV